MSDWKKAIITAGLEGLYFSGAHLVARKALGGIGVIFTLHHCRPARREAFQPNRLLEVTPEFLEAAIGRIRKAGLEIVSLDEMHRRLASGEHGTKRFACITFDDAYKDVAEFAWPVLKRLNVPFAIYVPTSFPDHTGEMWWLALERVIARNNSISLATENDIRHFVCGTSAEKHETWKQVYWWVRQRSSEAEIRKVVKELASRYGVDMASMCAELCMDWKELAQIAADPLVTIGAHTVSHSMLSKLPADAAFSEMVHSADIIEGALGARPKHFAYPVGQHDAAGRREFELAKKAGFLTAVTTRPGVLFPEHAEVPMALPRVSLNGEYQARRYVDVFLSGAPFMLWNGFKRVDAA